MHVKIRKFVVGFGALAALIGVYLLYTQGNRTPPIAAELAKTAPAPVVDGNTGAPGEVGTILGVGIDRVERTQFLHRNERNQVDRIFGFEQLLHKEGSQWEITNPYMKLFLPTFQCIVTANRGKVQVETVFARPMANDAMFSGNVLIHILPAEPNNALECFIHLDDVGFLAAQSLFSSAGAVRFFARGGQATGTGMELLYDEGRSRLELFQILKLGSLRFHSGALGSVADLTPQSRAGSAAPGGAPARPATVPGGPNTPADDRYRCIFHRNVAIEMPGRVIAARDELTLDNILWSNAKSRDALTKPALDPNDPNAAPYPGPNALDTSASSHATLSSIPPESFDTVVTCDGGLEVTLMGARPRPEDRRPTLADSAVLRPPSSVLRDSFSGPPDQQRTMAQRIHFDALTTDTMLEGPVAMAFLLDPNGLKEAKAPAPGQPKHDIGGSAAQPKPVPMTITAEKAVRFLAAANQVLFEGDCRATLLRSEPNVTYEYILTAPRLALDIASDPNSHKKKELAVAARKLVTDGGPAALRILRKRSDQLLGWTKLDAMQLQYETDPHRAAPADTAQAPGARFTAVGPGEIWIRNDETAKPQADPNQFSLGRPCLARLTNFDTLQYFTATNRITAENEAQQLLLDYFPLVDGKSAGHTRTVAGHVEASLQEATKGHLELATLTATKGIDYEDETKKLSFIGSTLSYDCSQSLVAVRGDAEQLCFLNGALVDQIDLNLKTGRLQAEIPTAGVFQVRR